MFPSRVYLRTPHENLVLINLSVSDVPAWFHLIQTNRARLSSFGNDAERQYPTPQALAYSFEDPFNCNKLRLGMWAYSTLVGYISASPAHDDDIAELGYYVGETFEGRGYAKSAVAAVVPYLFRLDVREVIASVHEENIGSRRVLEANGFGVLPFRRKPEMLTFVKKDTSQEYRPDASSSARTFA